ncbi:hypothetical protein KAR91_34270 [Candidatus Pacearchaeota archaeon]|nr:hypothetical protein [Candidatus Pacearchaeota archaeon]
MKVTFTATITQEVEVPDGTKVENLERFLPVIPVAINGWVYTDWWFHREPITQKNKGQA